MSTVLLVAAGLLALLGYARAVRRCRRRIQEGRAAARRRADVAAVFDRAAQRWDADTARLAAALEPLLGHLDEPVVSATAGFGDSIVAEERLREAFRSIDPTPAPAEEIPW